MIRSIVIWLAALTLLLGCSRPQEEPPMKAQEIIDASINAHGGAAYDNLRLDFSFRDKTYRIAREEANYRYERAFEQGGKRIRDVLDNGQFTRYIDGEEAQVVDSMMTKYSNSVNSVSYFVQLPYLLNDPAVKKTLLGKTTIKGIPYYKVQVNFMEEGGGEDFEDTYIYWVHHENFTIDYLAYDYLTDGGGVRFRQAYNPRKVNGVRIQDYINYKADHKLHSVQEMDYLFEKGLLEELSRIETVPL